ncbi:transcriptional regulator [Methylophaga nitratireducenticrescens]|nr:MULTISPECIES: helix-turn-helix transcriptional regulator [Methylophaga]ASF49130.1 transcriptional regulator [Methylophaga nitratireducenticrescens]MDO8827306.1 helix-turn-helix transcriptional regulator [Methylophaga sp.]
MNNRKEVFLSSNLLFLREIANLNKGELCSAVGTSNSEIGHLENDEISKPNYFMIEALADYFGVSIEPFVREDLSKRNPTELLIQRALMNLPALEAAELRSYLAVSNDLLELLSDKKYFDYRQRLIRALPSRRLLISKDNNADEDE